MCEALQECKKLLAVEFEMKYLGLMHYYLGLEAWQKPGEIYLGKVAEFEMKDLGLMCYYLGLEAW